MPFVQFNMADQKILAAAVLTLMSVVPSFGHASLRDEVAGQTFVCAQAPHTYVLTFDARARTVERRFNNEAVRKVRAIWSTPDQVEIPLETDLAEPALFIRRGRAYAYDGVPCRGPVSK